MTAPDILAELEKLGDPQTKKTLLRHGAKEPIFGVKIAEQKKIAKRTKANHQLALDLYDTGVSDAMYLAGIIAEPARMTKAQLRKWAKTATWHMISEYTVAGVAAESPFGWELGREWIDAKQEPVVLAGWNTLSGVVSITRDEDLDLKAIEALLARVQKEVAAAPNRVKYAMVMFVIAVGSYVAPLLVRAKQTAKALGTVEVDVGDTACKVPVAAEYIAKVESMGRVGRKKKTARC